MKLSNDMIKDQYQRLTPLYPKWVQYINERTLRLTPQEAEIMGQVWSEIMGKRWTGGCSACTLNAFQQVMSRYDKEADRIFQEQAVQEEINKQEDANTKKKTRRIKG
jgi:hypothetical protein